MRDERAPHHAGADQRFNQTTTVYTMSIDVVYGVLWLEYTFIDAT